MYWRLLIFNCSLEWICLPEGHLERKRKCTRRPAAGLCATEEAHRCSFVQLERDPITALEGFQASASHSLSVSGMCSSVSPCADNSLFLQQSKC